MRVPDFFEAITAYRVWSVMDNGLLCGRHHLEPWPVKQPMVGRCATGTRAHVSNKGTWKPPPVRGCTCGIYAYSSLEQAKKEQLHNGGWTIYSGSAPRGDAWGTVKIWGRVLELERGYRAEFAYPSEIITDEESLVEPLAIYGVPVRYEAPPPPPKLEPDDWWQLFSKRLPSSSFVPMPSLSISSVPFWRNLGTITSAFDATDSELSSDLVWLPPDEARSPIELTDEGREQRSVALWKKIAHGRDH